MKGWSWLVVLVVLLGLSACALQDSPAEPTQTLQPSPIPTLTATIDWFPTTATPTSAPVIAPTVVPTPQLGLSTSLLEDDFSDSNAWDRLKINAGSVAFGKNELTIAIAENKALLASMRHAPEMSNFYLEITASPSLCRAEDSYGLLLRASDAKNGYRWLVSCDGQTRVERLQNGYIVLLQDWVPSLQIRPGSPSEAHLAVWMNAREMRFYIEGIEQFTVSDPVYTSGYVGVFARAAADPPLTVNFSSLSITAVDPALVPLPTLTPTARLTLAP